MILYKQYPLTATATPLSDNSIFGLLLPSGITKVCFLSVKYFALALNQAYIGGSDVTNTPTNAGIQISSGGITLLLGPFHNNIIDLRSIYAVGTVNAANKYGFTVVIR